MLRVLFVCLGNICRSPMAEFIFKDMVEKAGLSDQFIIASAATSREEIGNPVHYGTLKILSAMQISCQGKTARQMTKQDYNQYDWLIGMEASNIRSMLRIAGADPEHKIVRLLDFTSHPRDISDPWYTGNFDKTKEDIVEGCTAFLQFLLDNQKSLSDQCLDKEIK